jgi:hypothetical protein
LYDSNWWNMHHPSNLFFVKPRKVLQISPQHSQFTILSGGASLPIGSYLREVHTHHQRWKL